MKRISLNGTCSPIAIDSGRSLEPSRAADDACRICFHSECTVEDPLISPCNCAGSMKYIHAACLRNWLKGKITTRHSERAASYFWKDLSCELCKESLPSFLTVNGRTIELVSIEYPTTPYLVLEDSRPDRLHESYGLHILSLKPGESLLVGRSYESDVKLNDVSVSRTHALVRFSNNVFCIEDLNSKFGTLLLMGEGITLTGREEVVLQASRCLLNFTVKTPWNCTCCIEGKVSPGQILSTVGGSEDKRVTTVPLNLQLSNPNL